MVDVKKLKEEELNQLNKKEFLEFEDEEVFNLESLIVDGADAKIPIIIKYPKPDGTMVKGAAMIRPLTNVEWNNAVRFNRNPNDNTSNEVELLKKALYTKEGKPFPPKKIDAMPNGVVLELVNEVSRISGVDMEENLKLVQQMMGFSV